MPFDRRNLIRAALAAPLMLGSGAAWAKQKMPPGADWNTWFHGWFGRDFGMMLSVIGDGKGIGVGGLGGGGFFPAISSAPRTDQR